MDPISLLTLLLPVAWLIWWIVVVNAVAKTPSTETTAKTMWILIVTVFPFLGLILWHWVGKSILGGPTFR